MGDRKIVLVDMDDTITWLLPIWVNSLNNQHGLSVDWRDIKSWDVASVFPTLTKDQVYEPLASENIWDDVKPRGMSVEVLTYLYNAGYEIYVCTSTDYRNVKPKYEKVIQKYFPFIDWRHVIIASNKGMIRADYIIDDAPHNLMGDQEHKFLLDMPHNLDFDAAANDIIRFANWEAILIWFKIQARKDKQAEVMNGQM